MTKEFKQCLKNKRIFEDAEAVNLSAKELKSAEEDFKEAKDRFKNKKYKYATHTAYYAYFHAARALVYLKGYRDGYKGFRAAIIFGIYQSLIYFYAVYLLIINK